MKTPFLILVLAVIPLACKSPECAVVDTAKIEKAKVASTMRTFDAYAKTHRVSAAMRSQVDVTYRKVKEADRIAEKAWRTYEAAQKAVPQELVNYQTALKAAATAGSELADLIRSLPK